ncbi:MAG: hypothetical protein MMC23_006989 [Stictis urceolatum]|nr:hypothetical protein [Stictis urceolata]
MSTQMSQALTRRSEDKALMPPPPPPAKRIKRPAKVLDEDTYTDALSHIIARDFFPGLVETEAQQEYLDSLNSKDKSWIESAGRRLAGLMTPGPEGRRKRARRGTSMTPMAGLIGQAGETPIGWAGDTPGSVVSTSTEREKPVVDTNLSLSAFQAKYTSEDNESFYELLDKQNSKKRDKYSWLWANNKIPAARQIAYRKQQAELEAAKEAQETEDGKRQLAIKAPDTRKAMPDSWVSRPDNNFMFEPSSVEDFVETVQQKAEAASRAAPKAVVYDNTRLPQPESSNSELTRPPSPTVSAVQDAIAGRPRFAASEVDDYDGSETPRVNGYTFVDSEEEPSDTESEPEQDWSKLSLGPGDSTPNPFIIKEKSSRETLHHRMVDNVAKHKRKDKAVAETKTPVPKFMSTPRINRGGMTPAAQRLLGKIGGRTPASPWVGSGSTSRLKGTPGSPWFSKIKTPRKEK